jgi:hypothetical protein
VITSWQSDTQHAGGSVVPPVGRLFLAIKQSREAAGVREPVGIGKPLPHTLNSLFTSLLPPYLVGDAVGLSITVTLISVVFWAWVLGPLGAVLAIPLTLLMKAVFIDADPRAAWAATLIGSTRSEARRSLRRNRTTRDKSRDRV